MVMVLKLIQHSLILFPFDLTTDQWSTSDSVLNVLPQSPSNARNKTTRYILPNQLKHQSKPYVGVQRGTFTLQPLNFKVSSANYIFCTWFNPAITTKMIVNAQREFYSHYDLQEWSPTKVAFPQCPCLQTLSTTTPSKLKYTWGVLSHLAPCIFNLIFPICSEWRPRA